MSIRVMTRVWEYSKHKGSKLLLLLAIADFADDDGFAWPGVNTLAKKIRMSTRQTKRLINDLSASNELYLKDRGSIGRSHHYLVTSGLGQEHIEKLIEKRLGGVENTRGGDNLSGVTHVSPQGDIAVSRGGDIAVSPEPLLSVNETPISACGEKEEAPAETHLEKLREKFGADPLEHALKATQALDKNGDRPVGWRDATEGEFLVCQRVASLWTAGVLPWSAKDIEKHLTAANKMIEMHNGDFRATVRTIDRYHDSVDGNTGFGVSGPYSLRNAIPAFIGYSQSESSRATVVERDGRKVTVIK